MILQYTQKIKLTEITYIELIRLGVLKAEGNECQKLGGYRKIN